MSVYQDNNDTTISRLGVSKPHSTHGVQELWLIFQATVTLEVKSSSRPNLRFHVHCLHRAGWLCMFDHVRLSVWHLGSLNSNPRLPFKITGAQRPLTDIFTHSRCTWSYCKACRDSHVAVCDCDSFSTDLHNLFLTFGHGGADYQL